MLSRGFASFVCFQASPGVIANPFATGIVRKNSMESISSIDRDLSPEEMDIMQKVNFLYIPLCNISWSFKVLGCKWTVPVFF